MLVTYIPLEDKQPESLTKYDIYFESGKPVEVDDVAKLKKLESHPLFNVAKEVKEVKPRKKRVTNDKD